MDLDPAWVAAAWPRATRVILLDTNALIWIEQRHRRVRSLVRSHRRLYISPANLLELQFLIEAERIRLRRGSVSNLVSGAKLGTPKGSSRIAQGASPGFKVRIAISPEGAAQGGAAPTADNCSR